MIPLDVWDHLRFGTGPRPGAMATDPHDGTEYVASRRAGRITVRAYSDAGRRDISPSQVPEGLEWRMYWTCEA